MAAHTVTWSGVSASVSPATVGSFDRALALSLEGMGLTSGEDYKVYLTEKTGKHSVAKTKTVSADISGDLEATFDLYTYGMLQEVEGSAGGTLLLTVKHATTYEDEHTASISYHITATPTADVPGTALINPLSQAELLAHAESIANHDDVAVTDLAGGHALLWDADEGSWLPGVVGNMLKSVYDADDDGAVDIAAGGTGAKTASNALIALGAAASGHDHAGVYDPAGTASGLVDAHELTYTHGDIATNKAAITEAVSTTAGGAGNAGKLFEADGSGMLSGRNVAADGAKLDYITVTQAVDLDDIETRVDALDAAVVMKGGWDASSGVFPGSGSAQAGWLYYVTVAGTVDGVEFGVNDRVIALTDNASTATYTANWFRRDYNEDVLSVDGLTGAVDLSGTYAPLGEGVTGGDSHAHATGDGAQISHTDLSGIGTNTHAQIDTHLAHTSNPHSVSLTDLSVSAFMQTVLDDANAAEAQETLGLIIGTNVQAHHAYLDDLAGITGQGTDDVLTWNGSNWIARDNGVLAVESSIDTTAAGASALYTVPAGKRFIPISAMFDCTVLTGTGAAHSAKWTADAADITTALQSSNAAVNDVDMDVLPGATAYGAGTVLSYEVTSVSTYDTHEGTAVLWGLLYDA